MSVGKREGGEAGRQAGVHGCEAMGQAGRQDRIG